MPAKAGVRRLSGDRQIAVRGGSTALFFRVNAPGPVARLVNPRAAPRTRTSARSCRRHPMALSATKFSLILWGLARVLNYTARKHPEFRERLKERNLVARIMARDEEIGRWFEFRDGKVRSGFGRKKKADVHARIQERHARRRPVDAADQLARSDQRPEGFQAHRRRPRGSDQLVCADHHGEPVRRARHRREACPTAACATAT